MKKIISGFLVVIMLVSTVAFSGCSEPEETAIESAEMALKVYFSALNGFNIEAMRDCVEGEDENDVGFSTENISESYVQTNKYKSSVENMYRALSKTIEFKIESIEEIDENKMAFNVNIKFPNIEEERMIEFTNAKVDEYIMANPDFVYLNEIEQNNVAIKVMADAYSEYLQITEKSESNFNIILSKESGDWKVHTKDNQEFFEFLAVLFG